jgi:hypothetical protein
MATSSCLVQDSKLGRLSLFLAQDFRIGADASVAGDFIVLHLQP